VLTYYLQPTSDEVGYPGSQASYDDYSNYNGNTTLDMTFQNSSYFEDISSSAASIDPNGDSFHCPFAEESMHSAWAYKAPVLLILACNMVFLVYIMAVR
jgi:hypothetical protein